MEITPSILPYIYCPVLGFKSVKDHVVLPEDTDYIIENIGLKIKKMVVLQNSYHVASMDNDKEQIVKDSYHCVQQHIGQGAVI
ncbi:alpha/beta hydrolase [Peribacillus asahii]|uniref:alpha/beta hydrolase n=1 Tax=Peribacillus asahii TaxID=228899 RepID=UPI0037FAEB35